jgi:hypothetical protein
METPREFNTGIKSTFPVEMKIRIFFGGYLYRWEIKIA